MNIILSNDQKVPMIKGWELEGDRVIATHEAKLNGEPVTVYVTKRNFYMNLSGAWYNGGLVSGKAEHDDILPILETEAASFRTARCYEITPVNPVLPNITGEKKEKAPAQEEGWKEENDLDEEEVSLTRINKKEARALADEGQKVYAQKYNAKKKAYVSDSVELDLSKGFDEGVESFYKAETANKSNIHFFQAK